MAGKLTIRRVGHLLPTLCLVGGLLLIAVTTWLCTAGLPSCALRYIEEEAARAGLPLTVQKIKISPSSGLAIKAEGIQLQLAQPDEAPAQVRFRKIKVAFSLTRLLCGQYMPLNANIMGGSIILPLSTAENDTIQLDELDAYAAFSGDGKALTSHATARIEGISLKLHVRTNDLNAAIDSLSAEADTSAADTSDALVTIREYIQQFKQEIRNQDWQPDQLPSLALTAAYHDSWKIDTAASIPCYNWDQYHLRDISLKGDFDHNTVTVQELNFRTVNPDTTVSLQAGYNLTTQDLGFSIKSTAPIVRMLTAHIEKDPSGLLNKIKPNDNKAPVIELSGNASITQDYAFNSITLRGKIEHHGLMLGRTQVDHILLSFFLRNGSFNIDNILLELPDGKINASAKATDGMGEVELTLSLPDETLLALIQDFGGTPDISLPEGLDISNNLELRIKGDMSVPEFEAGKSHLTDLIPTLKNCHIQLNTDGVSYKESKITNPALTVHAEGMEVSKSTVAFRTLAIDAMVGKAEDARWQAFASNALVNMSLADLKWEPDAKRLSAAKADFRTSVDKASMQTTSMENVHATATASQFSITADRIRSGALAAKISAQELAYDSTKAQDVYCTLDMPDGADSAASWRNLQARTQVEASIGELLHGADFKASHSRFQLNAAPESPLSFQLQSTTNGEKLLLQGEAEWKDGHLLHLDKLELALPLQTMLPILGGEPLEELKLPPQVNFKGSASIDTETGRCLECKYELQLPQLVRVCRQVYVHKGMEIPLALDITGDFKTSENGQMSYNAQVNAKHEEGELNIKVSGDPLSECHITGTNTIPVNIINALIDNADAHWIMRDFRCRPGITRNVVRNIDATIRYKQGIYVNVLCDAELYNMEFLLGVIRDKEDAQGNPTGEEYLRKDLGPNPYTMVKEGKCGVEVLVQMDCVDAKGNPLPERIRINLLNPDVLYDNKPWFKRAGIKSGPLTSRVTGEAVRFNIENNTISLHKLKGICYPAYSIGMYYAPIQHFLEDVVLTTPADVETDYCIFPLSRNCDVPMQGLIRAKAASGAGFKFLGTTIPLTHFSGFINISDKDVYLDRMNAECWGGVINGALRIGFAGKHTTLDGFFEANNFDLKQIVASYGEKFNRATCNGYIRFQADKPELKDVRAYGQVHLQDGDLMQMGLFRPISALLADIPGNLSKLQKDGECPEQNSQSWAGKAFVSVFDTGSTAIDTVQTSAYAVPFANHFLRYGIDEAYSQFDITNGHLITRNMKAKGYNLNVGVQLDIDLENLTLKGDLWPKISSVPTAILSPITILSKFLIDINIYGDLLNPQWKFGLSKKLKGEEPSMSSGESSEKKAN